MEEYSKIYYTRKGKQNPIMGKMIAALSPRECHRIQIYFRKLGKHYHADVMRMIKHKKIHSIKGACDIRDGRFFRQFINVN